MRKYLLLGSLFLDCSRQNLCINSCQLHYDSLPPEWTCEDVIKTQNTLMHELAFTEGDPRLYQCKLEAYTVISRNESSWKQYAKDGGWDYIGGATDCRWKVIEIGNHPPNNNALPHEMVHAMQNCSPIQNSDSIDDEHHSNWTEMGIKNALSRVWSSLRGSLDGGSI